jgi:hypothetical protein
MPAEGSAFDSMPAPQLLQSSSPFSTPPPAIHEAIGEEEEAAAEQEDDVRRAHNPAVPEQQLNFSDPTDHRLLQQLSNKLVPVDSKMLTVSSEDSKGSLSRRLSVVSNGQAARRSSRSADPSPRCG